MSTVHQKPPKIIPALLIVIGGMFIVFSFLADLLGYGDTGSFGIGQLFLLIVGGIVVLIGVFGKRSIQIYRDIAVVFLNTILFIPINPGPLLGSVGRQILNPGFADSKKKKAQDDLP